MSLWEWGEGEVQGRGPEQGNSLGDRGEGRGDRGEVQNWGARGAGQGGLPLSRSLGKVFFY